MLKERAMLVSLTIHQWNPNKFDGDVTAQVEQANDASDAGRFSKRLVPKEALKNVRTAVTALRDHHYKLTLSWGDNGERLLPAKLFTKYTDGLRSLKTAFEIATDDFVNVYPTLYTSAQTRLGKMFRSDDYPPAQEIRRYYSVATKFSPVADGNDFRVQLDEQDIERVRENMNAGHAERIEQSKKALWARLHEVTQAMYDRLSDDKAVFRDSLIENPKALVELIPSLNVVEDPLLTAAASELEKLLVPPQALRDRLTLRRDTAKGALDLLQTIELHYKP